MMVSANSAIWVSAEPMVAGPNRLRKSFTSSSSRGQRNAGSTPCREASAASSSDFEAAGDQHAPGRGMAGGRKEQRERERRHHRQVEQDRRRGGRRKAAERIEDAAVERHQRDQQQIGKRDARELDREREALAVLRRSPAPAAEITAGVKISATASSTTCTMNSSVKMRSANSFDGSAPRLLADARIGRHEGGVERALGEDRAEMIGQPQRHEEGVGDGPAPRMAASTMSRAKPVMRDSSVKPPTVKMRPIIGALVVTCPRIADRQVAAHGMRGPQSGMPRDRSCPELAAAPRARSMPPSARRTAAMMRSCVGSSR